MAIDYDNGTTGNFADDCLIAMSVLIKLAKQELDSDPPLAGLYGAAAISVRKRAQVEHLRDKEFKEAGFEQKRETLHTEFQEKLRKLIDEALGL
jgi:hypothetical protein